MSAHTVPNLQFIPGGGQQSYLQGSALTRNGKVCRAPSVTPGFLTY